MTPVTIGYWLAVLGFAIGLGIVAALRLSLDDSPHKQALTYLAVIPIGAGIAYAVMALDIGTIQINGLTLVVPRYIDWLVTTPLLVGFVGYVASAPRRAIGLSMAADVAMVVTGLIAVITSGAIRWTFFAMSSAFYLGILYYLYIDFPKYLSEDYAQVGLYSLLKIHIGLLWIAYPVVWIAGSNGFGFATAAGISLTYAFLDVFAKVPYVYFFYTRREYFAASSVTTSKQAGSADADSIDAIESYDA